MADIEECISGRTSQNNHPPNLSKDYKHILNTTQIAQYINNMMKSPPN